MKIIYVATQTNEECVKYFEDDPIEEIIDAFRSAAEAIPGSLIKLFTNDGKIMKINKDLPQNTPETRYQLIVVGLPCSGKISTLIGVDLHLINDILFKAERQKELKGPSNEWFVKGWEKKNQADEQLSSMMNRLMYDRKFWWIGLTFEEYIPRIGPSLKRLEGDRDKHLLRCKKVFEDYTKSLNIFPTLNVCDMLKSISFDNWQWEDYELILLIRTMFLDLNICGKFSIDLYQLQDWLFEVYMHYEEPPFHSFKHCFMVTQMSYFLINLIGSKFLKDFDIFVLIVSAICHDMGHPGTNNTFQINMRTDLATLYNDVSPLENYHCKLTFETLCRTKLIDHFDRLQYNRFRELVIHLILATDMLNHREYILKFKQISGSYNMNDKAHNELLLIILMKISDISNELRPIHVSSRWLDCLLLEFAQQFEQESKFLPPSALSNFMNPKNINKATVQIQFITFVMLPLQESLAELDPIVYTKVISKLKESLDYWVNIKKKAT